MKYILILLCIAVSVSFCTEGFTAQPHLQKAWAYYLKSDYENSIDTCRLISKDKILGEEGHYLMGLSFLNLKSFDEARKNLTFALDNYPKSNIKEDILLSIADSYYLEERYPMAEEYYTRLLRTYPQSDYASISYLRLGISQRGQGKWQEAKSSFYRVVNDYSLSFETEEARSYLEKKAPSFSVQVGAFSKRENAERLSGNLEKKGYSVFVEKSYEKDKLIYRVKVGRFDTKNGVENEAMKLKKEGFSVKICS